MKVFSAASTLSPVQHSSKSKQFVKAVRSGDDAGPRGGLPWTLGSISVFATHVTADEDINSSKQNEWPASGATQRHFGDPRRQSEAAPPSAAPTFN